MSTAKKKSDWKVQVFFFLKKLNDAEVHAYRPSIWSVFKYSEDARFCVFCMMQWGLAGSCLGLWESQWSEDCADNKTHDLLSSLSLFKIFQQLWACVGGRVLPANE